MRPRLQCELETVIHGGDEIAVITDRWQMEATGSDGGRIALAGRGMHVIRSRHGGWRFLISGLANLPTVS